MSARRRASSRDARRRELEALWKDNCARRERGEPLNPDRGVVTLTTIDKSGKFTTRDIRGKVVAEEQRWAERLSKLQRWENPKEIAGPDIVEILNLAFEQTNDRIFSDAAKAMKSHGLDRGGIKRALLDLRQRAHPHLDGCAAAVRVYVHQLGWSVTRAAERVVAASGISGASFQTAVDAVRKAYAACPDELVESAIAVERGMTALIDAFDLVDKFAPSISLRGEMPAMTWSEIMAEED